MAKVKIGILGATRGIDFALAIKKYQLDAEIVAVCDSFEPVLEKVRAILPEHGFNARYYTSFDEMLASDVEAVVIANFANEHAPFAIKALKAGKHVMSEVLPVQTPAQAVALCEAVESSGKIYRYAENYCYWRSHFETRLRFEAGEIGELVEAESEFINDCSGKWHMLTRGMRNHWRNLVPSTFYCTHSIGPVLFSTGLRPVRVAGYEANCCDYMKKHGARSGSAGMEVIELSNGALFKSTHGNLRRPWHTYMRLCGTKGAFESRCGNPGFERFLAAPEGTDFTSDRPELHDVPGFPNGVSMDWNVFQIQCFIGAIQGNALQSKYGIDVYMALDMALPGLFAYYSILDGNRMLDFPDFRDRTSRGKYRSDNRCTDPAVASGDELLPSCSRGEQEVPDEVYQREAEKLIEEINNKFKLGMN